MNDEAIPLSTHDLLTWIGALSLYAAFTTVAIYQWRHPEHVPSRWFPFHEEETDRTDRRRVIEVRASSALILVVLNVMATCWVVDQLRS